MADFRTSPSLKQVNSGKSDQPMDPPAQLPRCPSCGSTKIWKDFGGILIE